MATSYVLHTFVYEVRGELRVLNGPSIEWARECAERIEGEAIAGVREARLVDYLARTYAS